MLYIVASQIGWNCRKYILFKLVLIANIDDFKKMFVLASRHLESYIESQLDYENRKAK